MWRSALLVVAACGRIDFDPPPALPECSAQRVVHVAAAAGSFGYFTLVWPVPATVAQYQPMYAIDDPALAIDVTAEPDHPLYARRALWQSAGRYPMPSVYLEGNNETHTSLPISTTTTDGIDLVAAGARAQLGLGAPLPVLAFGTVPYGPAPGAPNAIAVSDIDAAIAALRAVTDISPELEAELRPDPATLATWYAPGAIAATQLLAERLLFAANAFRHGLAATVIVPYTALDDHDAFSDVPALTAKIDDLAGALDGFYRELAAAREPACSHHGASVALADNVVLIANGDTPKSVFSTFGWGDGSPMGVNWLYVRGNGYLRPGWFGDVAPTGSTRFDPTTGALSTTATNQTDIAAAVAATAFAIARGDASVASAITGEAYDGLIAPATP